MSAQHTPGPWKRSHVHPDESTRASLAYIEGGDRLMPAEIATVYLCDVDPAQAANATLIAAAPDLLAALEAMLDQYDHGLHSTSCVTLPPGFDGKWCCPVARARTAIAKARGQA